MATEITLSETPRRQARITVGDGDNSLTWTFDAPGMSDRAWRQLIANGFGPDLQADRLRDEDREAHDFRDRVATVVATLNGAVETLERNRAFDNREESFLDFFRNLVTEDKKAGIPPSRINKYLATLSRFKKYLQTVAKEGLRPSNISSDIMADFNDTMADEGLKPSTRAFYNRTLLAIYQRAVAAGLTPDNAPFAKVATQYRVPAAGKLPPK